MQPAIRIAVIGSSTAAGQGAEPPENGWVNLYRAYLKNLNPGNEVVNLALGGQQTYQLLPTGHRPPPARPVPDPERNITKALSYLPDAVLVNVPSNDAAAFYGATEQMRNFEAIAQAAQAAGVPVWIATTQPRAFSPRQIDIQIQVRDAILSRYGAQALDFWSPLALPSHLPNPKLVIGDGAHLNNRGHRLLFEMVRDKNLPAAIAEWKFRRRQLTRLEPGTQL
ncbi:MAG: SGNH/GDSL hydrolase family protein, partial [Saprospiraceae bacterium]|nr:SGNH/GDSL hydrolase family protein [Saprospiraceae bacterium]